MIKRFKPLLVALIAVFAFSGLAAASAVASPEFEAVGTKTFPLLFTSLGGLAELTTKGHEPVHCTAVHNHGLILPQPTTTRSMLGDVEFDFLGCTTKGPFGETSECKTHGAAKELILTPNYLWHLGKLYTLANGVKHVLILILVSETNFECPEIFGGGATIKVTGDLVGLLHAEYNVATEAATVSFSASAPGSQELKTFETLLPEETKTELDLKAEIKDVLGTETELAAEEASGHLEVDGPVILRAP